MIDVPCEQIEFLESDFYNKLSTSTSTTINKFSSIWEDIIKKTHLDINIDTAFTELQNLVIYEALDGSRSTLNVTQDSKRGVEGALYVIHFIHLLKTLGAKICLIMIHTSYNRARGDSEFKNILQSVEVGASLIKRYTIVNNIRCSCICNNEDYELTGLLQDISNSTKNGKFHTYFLFDYSEEWGMSKKGINIIKNLPNIDVHIRHTKFQFSGGWIPGKMSRSVFLYSQNGTIQNNWKSDELLTLIALALLAKLIHQGEVLNKVYATEEEINQRYDLRELKLFNKVIHLREHPKKLFIMGSPIGVYQFYY